MRLPLGGHGDDGDGRQVTAGGDASRCTLTDSDVVPPSLVAVQVRVLPLVSLVTVVASQADVPTDEGPLEPSNAPLLCMNVICGSTCRSRRKSSIVPSVALQWNFSWSG
jgi:hypothetical protein